jgi:threonyl-tRNA synthetase
MQLIQEGHKVKVDITDKPVHKKRALAQKEKWNYIIVVGVGEQTAGTVTVSADKVAYGEHTIEAFISTLNEERFLLSTTSQFEPL